MDQAARAVKAVVMRFLELARHTAVGGRAWQSTGNGHQRRRRHWCCRKSPEASSSRGRWHHSRVGRTGRHRASRRYSRVEVVGGRVTEVEAKETVAAVAERG